MSLIIASTPNNKLLSTALSQIKQLCHCATHAILLYSACNKKIHRATMRDISVKWDAERHTNHRPTAAYLICLKGETISLLSTTHIIIVLYVG